MATVEKSAPASPPHVIDTTPAHQPGDRQQVVGRVGPWQLVRLLSESELARVYIARPAEAVGKPTANYVIKLLRNEWWRDPQAIEMQRRAAWIGRQVSHPHLLAVLSAAVGQPPFYLVTPWVDGRPLSDAIGQQGRMALPVKLWIVRQVADALAALHESTGMVHADVKPSNIIVSPDGHATLIDLGFAHLPDENRHWSMRPVVGTLSYAAPEVLTSSLAAGPASDLYSLGVTLYELLSGQLPLAADTPDELVRLHRESAPPCIRHLVPTLPKDVASLVHRLLAKDTLRRPDSAAAVVEELTRLEIDCFAMR